MENVGAEMQHGGEVQHWRMGRPVSKMRSAPFALEVLQLDPLHGLDLVDPSGPLVSCRPLVCSLAVGTSTGERLEGKPHALLIIVAIELADTLTDFDSAKRASLPKPLPTAKHIRPRRQWLLSKGPKSLPFTLTPNAGCERGHVVQSLYNLKIAGKAHVDGNVPFPCF
eukprot:6170587-Pleurochrysis_carterae.AAC.2